MLIRRSAGCFKGKIRIFEHLPCLHMVDMDMSMDMLNRVIGFLGGLSLHLNRLIASHMGICYGQFGTLPIGIFLSNLGSRQLDTSLITSYGHFCDMSFFGNSRAI